MSTIAIYVEYDVKPERRADFERLMRAHAAGTLADEEGCLRFDFLTPRDDSGKRMVYEVYRDDAALAIHNRSPRLPKVRADYENMITGKRLVLGDVS